MEEDSNIAESAAAAPPAAAAQATGGPGAGRRRLLQALGVDAVGPLSVALSASACITALRAPVLWTPAVVLASVVTLFVGLWVSTLDRGGGRGNIIIAFVNLCVSFLALVVAVGLGGDFDPDLLLELYGALI